MRLLTLCAVGASAAFQLPGTSVPRSARRDITKLDESEACLLLPWDSFPGPSPSLLCGAVELQELEDDAECRTLVWLNADGTVSLGPSNGPPPVSDCGLWQAGADAFQMVLQRTFSSDPTVMPMTMKGFPMKAPLVYTVTRVYLGSVDHASSGPNLVAGKLALFDDEETTPAPADEWDARFTRWEDEVFGLMASPIGYFTIAGNVQPDEEEDGIAVF